MYDGILRFQLSDRASVVGFADDQVLEVVAESTELVEIIANGGLEIIAH